ncbi:hypothetical protein Ddc_01303 [Ditylenchus destructor]|nr:hypothetical protein Ddc_01303 [Ditylenchus destructor]
MRPSVSFVFNSTEASLSHQEQLPNIVAASAKIGNINVSAADLEVTVRRSLENRLSQEECSFRNALAEFEVNLNAHQKPLGLVYFLERLLEIHVSKIVPLNLDSRSADLYPCQKACRDEIGSIYKSCLGFMRPDMFLASMAFAMLSAGFVDDAKEFASQFSIPATCYIFLLRQILDQSDLEMCDRFAQLYEYVYQRQLLFQRYERIIEAFVKQHGDLIVDQLKCREAFEHIETVKQENLKLQFLVSLWKKNKFQMRKEKMANIKYPKHKVDPVKVDELAQSFSDIWVSTAVQISNVESLERFCNFVRVNEIMLKEDVYDACRSFYERRGEECPLTDKQCESHFLSSAY